MIRQTRPRRGAVMGSAGAPQPRSALVGVPNNTKLSLRVHLRLATCRNLLMRESRRSVERWGLTLPQFDVLAELGRAPKEGFTFVELSRLLLVTSGNLTGIVDRLTSDGLMIRADDARDRRLVRVVLTKKGRQLIDEIMPLHARDIQAILAFMPAERLNALNELLGELRNGLRGLPIPDAESKTGRRHSNGQRRPTSLVGNTTRKPVTRGVR
jgi:DNA-binding MarR family transcriptional regulator